MPDPAAHQPLTGLRIVEVSMFVAAPLGGMTLAQLGAEVVRVDPLGGAADHTRWPLSGSGTSLYWTGLNKVKRSAAVDLRSAEGQELVTRLICESGPGGGIVLTNTVGRSWLSYEVLVRRRPDVICLQIEGNADGSAAVDYTVNASHGFPLLTGPAEHAGPVNHVLPAWDVACGLYAAIGLLAAERRRTITGQGQELRLALSDVALATAGNLGFLAEAQLGQHRARLGNYLYGGFGRDFVSRDGRRFMLVTLTSRHWRDLVTATGLGQTVTAVENSLGVDFTLESDRYQYRELLAALLQRWSGERDFADVRAVLDGSSVLWSPYQSFGELAEGGQLRANPLMGTVDQPGVGPHLAPGSPIRAGERVVERAPVLGEHTDMILAAWLGLGSDEIRALHERGTVEGGTVEGGTVEGGTVEGGPGHGPAGAH
jgi:2-methylfumaryl-CoA isomerase